MQDDCIAVALGLPQLKILWQQEREVLVAQGKLQGLVPGNERSRAEEGQGGCDEENDLKD